MSATRSEVIDVLGEALHMWVCGRSCDEQWNLCRRASIPIPATAAQADELLMQYRMESRS